MEVTREFFAPVIIKIDRITELELLMDVDMSNALSDIGL